MAPRVKRDTGRIELGQRGRIAAVADTHSRPHPQLMERLRSCEPDAIVHAGDIGDLAVLEPLAELAPLHAVRGNIDTRAPNLPDELTLDVQAGQRNLRMLLLHIAVYGAKIRADVAKRARAENAALIVCGHSHVPFIGQENGLTVFNPGSVGPRRFHLPIVFGLIDIEAASVRLTHIDCETGQPWSPP